MTDATDAPDTGDAPTWSALLTGDDAERANATLDAITADLRALDPATVGAELAGGAAGLALYFAYLSQIRGDEQAGADAERWLDAAVHGLSKGPHAPAILGGYAGIGWAAAHLCDDDTAAEVCTVIDDGLLSLLTTTPAAERDYDFIAGMAGFATYALAAPPTPRGAELRAALLDQFEGLAVEDAGGLAWFTPAALLPEWQAAICPDGYFNLGLGHGIPGVVAVMARYLAAGIEPARAGRLLDGGVRWLLTAAPAGDDHGRFPAWRGRGAGDKPARLAWCYGDPGVCPPLLAAARATGNQAWEHEARLLATHMARRPVAEAGVVDGGLCHGAGGLGHILNRLGQALGDDEVKDSARFWLRALLDMAKPGDGVGGFRAYRGDEPPIAEAGFLTGAAGIGLTLLAATSELDPGWDQALLVDV